MKLSLNWLNDYIDLKKVSLRDIEHRLTLSTCEVDGTEEVFSQLRDVLCVEITSVKAHPDADKLRVCTADTGKEKLQIVTGAPNVKEKMMAVLAPVGCTLRTDGKEPLTIKPAKLRGIDSFGMLCSASELGLDKIFSGDGLLDLQEVKAGFPEIPAVKPGMKLSEILSDFCDTIIEIDNKSITNRADLWSHFGFARELAAQFRLPLLFNPLDFSDTKRLIPEDKSLPVKKIIIEKGAAESYYGVHVSGVKAAPSPLRIQARLLNIGQKPVNSIVDVSNYVMFETGQPNHTFDSSLLKKDTVSAVLNTGNRFKTFRTLDDEERNLPPEAILILDGDPQTGNPVAIGGIMGGLDSGIAENTSSLFIESATFPRAGIRFALSKLQLRTDAAVRFEKGQDPANARAAIFRILELLKTIHPDLKTGSVSGEAPVPERRNEIRTTLRFIQGRLGFPVSVSQITDMLESIGFEVKSSGEKNSEDTEFMFRAPTYRSRHDISIPEDIIEELGRLYGYDNIEPVAPPVPLEAVRPNEARILERLIKRELASLGFSEVHNYSFVSAKANLPFGGPGVRLLNPVMAERDHMRLSLIPGILEQAAVNQDRYENVRLFEAGRTYHKKNGKDTSLPEERNRFAVLHLTGETPKHRKNLHEDETLVFQEFLSLRGALETILMKITGNRFITAAAHSVKSFSDHWPFLHPNGSVVWLNKENGEPLGAAGILHPEWQNKADLKRSTLAADLSFDSLLPLYHKAVRSSDYTPPSVFPDSSFEISVILEGTESTSLPVDLIMNAEGKWKPSSFINEIRFLSQYRGEPLPEGKKSVSYEIICRADGRTLTGEEIRTVMEEIIGRLGEAGITLRQ